MRSTGILLLLFTFLLGAPAVHADTVWEDFDIMMTADGAGAGSFSGTSEGDILGESPADAAVPLGGLPMKDISFFSNGAFGSADPGLSVNIVCPTVPLPGAVWLFGAGLLGLLGFRRKAFD